MATRAPTPDRVQDHHATPLRGWLLGLVAGSLGGLVLISWGVAMPWLGVIAIVVGGFAPPRPLGLSGTLIGWGATWAALFLRAGAACDPASCVGPDLFPWLLACVGLVVVGAALPVIGRARSRARS